MVVISTAAITTFVTAAAPIVGNVCLDLAKDYVKCRYEARVRSEEAARQRVQEEADAQRRFKLQKEMEEDRQRFQSRLQEQNQAFQEKIERSRQSFAAQMQANSQDFQREMTQQCQEFQTHMEEDRQRFEFCLEENRQRFQQNINDKNAQLQRELNEQNHMFRLEEIKVNFELLRRTQAYQQVMVQWPLNSFPDVLRREQILANNRIALRVLFSHSSDAELQQLFYPIIERELVKFASIYNNNFNSNNIIFYQNAWKVDCFGSAFESNIHFILKDIPVLIVEADILPDNSAAVSFTMWGLGSEKKFKYTIFEYACDRDRIVNDMSYRSEAASKISAYLKFVIGYMYDLYNLVLYNCPPLLPKVAQYEGNCTKSALLKYDDVKQLLYSIYNNIYSKVLSIASSGQSAEIKVLADTNNTILHKTRFEYAEAVKDYVSAEEYLQFIDESARAWTELRTSKNAETFLKELVDNSNKIDDYFSSDDNRYFQKLCNVYLTANNLTELGRLCLQVGIYINAESAVKYYLKEADLNKAEAQYRIAQYYRINGNYEEAFKWYMKAAEQGYTKAKEILCEIDKRRKAKEKFETLCKDADQGDMESQFELAEYYYTGNDKINIEQNYLEAVKWYRRAAEYGHGFSLYRLGYCYQFGYGLDKDLDKAMKCYRKALDNGYEQAKEPLNKLEECNKAKENREKFEALLRDAKCGDMEAQYNLGEHYFTNKNYEEAEKWYKQACDLGYDKAKAALERLEKHKQAVKNFESLRKEAEYGNLEAQYQLA